MLLDVLKSSQPHPTIYVSHNLCTDIVIVALDIFLFYLIAKMHHGDSNMPILAPAQKRSEPPSDNIDHTAKTHMTHANRRNQKNSVKYAHLLLCNENPRTPGEHLPQPPPSHPQPLTTNKFSVPCLSNKHTKMRCLIQSLQVQKIRFQKVQFATIRLKHTTRY